MKRLVVPKKIHHLVLVLLIAATVSPAMATGRNKVDYATMSLEELMNIEITSASKKEERLRETAAAVSVLTSDDIARMGATTIPDTLRYLPGVHVANQDAHQWAVSIRGFNDIFANKLLVVMDGRSIYTPLFSGVFWNTTDTFLEDLEQIEVVRGPGATVWGANAVNGVINVISKDAKHTQGWLLSGIAGTEDRGIVGARYGGQLGDGTHYRVYGKYLNRDASALADGSDAVDSWQQGRTGFRIDSESTPGRHLTLQGEMFSNREEQRYHLPAIVPPFVETTQGHQDTLGAHLLGRWTEKMDDDSDISLQAYYDVTHGTYVILEETRQTADVEFQHRFRLGDSQEIVWGLGYRVTSDEIENMERLSVNPNKETDNLFSAFVQDEVTLVPGRMTLAAGSKFEHNDFTGFEVQPSVRTEWTPCSEVTLWGAVSRAVRSPSRIDEGAFITMPTVPPGAMFPGSPLTVPEIQGSRSFDSEELIAYELGLRAGLSESLSLDAAFFYHDYDKLRTSASGSPRLIMDPAMPYIAVPSTINNDAEGESYGAELAAMWQVDDWWRLSGSYTLLKVKTRVTSPASEPEYVDEGSSAPRHQVSLWSRMDVTRRTALDIGLRFVDELEGKDVDDYTVMDIHLSWQASEDCDVSIVARNLLEKHHAEWSPSYIESQPTEVEQSVYGKITWRFE